MIVLIVYLLFMFIMIAIKFKPKLKKKNKYWTIEYSIYSNVEGVLDPKRNVKLFKTTKRNVLRNKRKD